MTLPVRRGRGRDPLAEIDDLFGRIGSLLESTVGAERAVWAPPADLTEADDAFVVEVELPGMRREDIDIRIGERELSITGELREGERAGVLHRGTRRTGRFEYRATLPGPVAAGGVTATLDDGVLTVRLPKTQDTGVRHIEIEGGD